MKGPQKDCKVRAGVLKIGARHAEWRTGGREVGWVQRELGGGGGEKDSESLDPNNTGLTVDRQVLKKRKGRCITRPQEE